MKNVAALFSAIVLAAGTAQAASVSNGNADYDMPSAPVVATQTVQMKASDLLSKKELERSGISADAQLNVSDFTAPGPRSTYTR